MISKDICMICRDKAKPGIIRQKITTLQEILRYEEADEGSWYLNWGIRFRCRFGIGCPKLDVARSELENLARSLNPKMRSLALHGKDGMFYKVLSILQGDFPAVYRQMTIWRAEGRKEHGKSTDDASAC